MIKKYGFILGLTSLLTSCYTATYQQSAGTMTGAMIGSSVGSLFGGLADGPRGNWWGTAIGTIAGAAIGNAVNAPRSSARQGIDDETENPVMSAPVARTEGYTSLPQDDGQMDLMQQLDVRNIKFVDENHDLKLNPEERCKLIFEIHNLGSQTVSSVFPVVYVNSQKKHIFMSQPVRIERIDAGEGLRYTVSIYTDRRLKTGSVGFTIALSIGGQKPQIIRTFDLSCENNRN